MGGHGEIKATRNSKPGMVRVECEGLLSQQDIKEYFKGP